MNARIPIFPLFLVFLLIIFIAGCAWGEQPPWDEGGDVLELRAFMRAQVRDDFVYHFAVDTDGNPLTGPGINPAVWEGYWVVEWENGSFFITDPEGNRVFFFEGEIVNLTDVVIRFDLEEIGEPREIQVMVVVTDRTGSLESAMETFRNINTRTDFVPRVFNDIRVEAIAEPSSTIDRVEGRITF